MERPKVLVPLVNVPMLDYTLEWLASAGVEEARQALRRSALRAWPCAAGVGMRQTPIRPFAVL